MRYLAADIYAYLKQVGCEYDGETYATGAGWLSPSCQVFMLPEPDFDGRHHWFDAASLDHMCADRWLGFDFAHIKRHP